MCGENEPKKEYIKIGRDDMGFYLMPIAAAWTIIEAEFDGSDEGDKITLEKVLMTEEEYKKLPEFMGW